MKLGTVCVLAGFLSLVLSLAAQTSGISPASAQVPPPLIQFSNVATDEGGTTLSGVVSITFSLYSNQQGGEPLWTETQNNVQLDPTGHYSVQLGITRPNGVPTTLFTTGEARWLGMQIAEQTEQPRVLLLSVPYALKAGDAATVGGLPPSAFVLAAPTAPGTQASPESASATSTDSAPPIGGSGTTDYIPRWTDNNGNLGNSILYQSGTGSSAKIGINTTSPLTTLDVKGTELVRGLFEMATMNFASPTKGYDSQPFNLESSAYNSGTEKYTLNHFQWQAEPTGNNTTTPGATLNLLYGTDPAAPAETGLNVGSNGQITFASGQVFPGAGTVTSVGSGAGLTGGPITGAGTLSIANAGVTNAMLANPSLTVKAGTDLTGGGSVSLGGTTTLNVDTTKVPQLNTANTFTGNQTVNGNLTATGVVTGSSYQIGSNLFAFGSYANGNAFLGFAGNTTTTGIWNTASGQYALYFNTSGYANTASGEYALYFNTSGTYNTASGFGALSSNTSGYDNTASGTEALNDNTTGHENTASGLGALYSNTSGSYNTASGYNALSANTTATENTADGYNALTSTSTGGGNTASGFEALYSDTTGYFNTAVGYQALYNNTTGTYLTCIGYECVPGEDGLSNATAIGAHAVVSQSNSLVLGGTGQWAVKVGIGTATPSNILTIARGAGHPVSDSWETYSSRRWKTNIHPLANALGKVEQLRGVSYDLKNSGKHEIGVIAEEVGQVVPEVVSYEKNGKDATGVDYSRLTALLIEATKEQQREIQHQQAALRTQAAAIRDLKSELRATRQTLQKVKAQVAAAQLTVAVAK